MAYAYQPGGPGGSYSSPVFNYSSVADGFQGMLKAFQDASNQANLVNEQRYRDILGGWQDLYSQQQGSLADILARNAGIFGNTRSELGGLYGEQQGTLADILARNTGIFGNARGSLAETRAGNADIFGRMYGDLSQMGVQQKKDIIQQFANTSAKARQDLVGSGLGGSTILPNVMGGISRQEADAQGRLEDTLAQQRVQVGGQEVGANQSLGALGLNLSGQEASSNQSLGALGLNTTGQYAALLQQLGGQEASFNQSLGALGLNLGSQNAGNALSFMERRNDQMPDLSMLASLASAYGAGGGGLPRYQYQPQSISTQGYRMPGLGSFMGAFPMQTRAAQRINGGYAGFIA